MVHPGSAVSIDAQPDAFEFVPATTAVIIVDMQNDFGADGWALADAFRAEGVVRRGRDRVGSLPVRGFHKGWHEVVHEGAGQVVAVLVVDDLFVEGRRKALRQSALSDPSR